MLCQQNDVIEYIISIFLTHLDIKKKKQANGGAVDAFVYNSRNSVIYDKLNLQPLIFHILAQRLFQIETSSPSTHHTADHQPRRWRNKFLRISRNRGTSQEMHSGFKTHFLERRGIRLNSNAIESFDRSIVCHVISN